MTSNSSSELSDAPSDVAQSTAATSITGTTVQRAVKASQTAPRGKKRSTAQSTESTTTRTKRARQTAAPSYAEESDTDGPTPKKRASIRKLQQNEVSAHVKLEVEAEVDLDASPDRASTKKPKRKPKTPSKVELEEEGEAVDGSVGGSAKKPKRKPRTKTKVEAREEAEAEDGTVVARTKRKRKTKEEKEAEQMPIAARTVGSKLFLGAHVSGAGGVHNAVTNSVHIGGNAFALFLKSQRKWANPPMNGEHIPLFHSHCKEHSYDSAQHVVPHGSYLVNLAHPDRDRATQAYDAFFDDLTRCKTLGIQLYNFHPGNCSGNESRKEGIGHIAQQLNRAHKDPGSGKVITLLETMAAGGNVIGSAFEDLAEIIELVDRKDRVGVCLDTCHVFAAGYDLRAPETFCDTFAKFEQVIGLKYLRALHVNDSKAPFSSFRDLHANIGTGFLGLRAFHNLVNDERIWGLPLILETPIDVKDERGKDVQDKSIWAREIKLLENLVSMDVESREFKDLEQTLADQGVSERQKYQEQVDKREEKRKQKAENEKTKGMKGRGRKKANAKAQEEASSSVLSNASDLSSE